MTTSTMLSDLGVRLNDVNEDRFSSSDKLAMLNTMQIEVASLAPIELLDQLQATNDFTAEASGKPLPGDYFRYVNSKLRSLNPQKWITKRDVDNLSVEGNRYLKGTDASPTCYIWDGLYYLNVTTFSGSYIAVRLYYIKTPTTLTTTVNSSLHSKLHPLLVDLAEAQLGLNSKLGDPEVYALKIKNAYEKINALGGISKRSE